MIRAVRIAACALAALPGFLADAQLSQAGLRDALDRRREAAGLVGLTAAVTLPDGTLVASASGLARRGTDQPMQPTSRMMGGSSGKTFVAAVLLELVDEGALGLDDLLAKHLGDEPWFARLPNAESITLRHLLNHTSGLRDHVREPAFAEAVNEDPERAWAWPELIAFILDSEPLNEAGESFAYADTNYILVGMVIEGVTGRTVYDLVADRILTPLALHGTIPQSQALLPGLVSGYNQIPLLDMPEEVCVDGVYAINPQWEWCGGGFVTTSADMARWIRSYADGSRFADGTHEHMTTGVRADTGPGDEYGLGLQTLSLPAGRAIGHSGFMPGYVTIALYFPELNVSVAVQINESSGPAFSLLRPLANELASLAAGQE